MGEWLPFLKPAAACNALSLPALEARALLQALLQISDEPDGSLYGTAFVQTQLQAIQQREEPLGPPTPEALPVPIAPVGSPLSSLDLRAGWPVVQTELAWLDHVLQAGNNQQPLALTLQMLQLALAQDSALARRCFEQCLVQQDGPLGTAGVFEPEDTPEAVFTLAVLQVALGRPGRLFLPESLGFTYAYCQTGGLLGWLTPTLDLSSREALPMKLPARLPALWAALETELQACPEQAGAFWAHVAQGHRLYARHWTQCIEALQGFATPATNTAQVGALFARLRGAALGLHGDIPLGDKTLEAWFAQGPFDTTGFLQALRQSPYIDARQPSNSRLLQLFAFNGPMFGVLADKELQVLADWIAHPADSPEPSPLPPRPALIQPRARVALKPHSLREAYSLLVNSDRLPEALTLARRRVQQVLRATRLTTRLPFETYTQPAFARYVNTLYQREVQAYRPLAGPPRLAKATYVWAIEQFAPTILTDGCWLQHSQRLKYQHPVVARLLHSIYVDELGAGVLAQNHPQVYTRLLASIGLTLPGIDSVAFYQHSGFIDSAFDIPTYLLAIAQFPGDYLPELLGLNLAIELSGLGKDYLRLAQALTFHGLDARIVTLHISIDNPATGHAALACQAIERYLHDLAQTAGPKALQQHWRRVYTGYASLAWVSRRFALALVSRGLVRSVGRWFKPAGQSTSSTD